MLRSKMNAVLVVALLLVPAAPSPGQTAQPAAKEQEAKLIAVLKSDAPQKEKADACRELARIGGKDAVAPLAALLGDEKLSHMARYGLETILDPAVDLALCDALGKLKARPLVGVIGSIGVRRDAKAVEPLAKLLSDADPDVAQAAARALGKIGVSEAVKPLSDALAKAPAGNRVALCEGLFRCAESLAAKGQSDEALAIYDNLRRLQAAPHQVRAGALRGAVLLRKKDGLPLLMEAIRGNDFVLVAAAARTSQEMPGAEVTQALAGELGKLTADKQIVMIQTLANRADAGALPALFAAARKGDAAVRVAAIRSFPMIGGAAAVPVLVELLGDADQGVAKAAKDSFAGLSGPEVDAAVVSMLNQPDAGTRAMAIDVIGQRRMLSAIPALLKAAEGTDEPVRLASLKSLGELAGAAELPAMVGLLVRTKSPQETQAAEASLAAICARQSVPATGKVTIKKAVYGALPDGASADVTKKVAEMVKAGAMSVEASNDNFGDPANGSVKMLRVEFTVDGRGDTRTVNEGETLTFPAGVTPPGVADALCGAMAQAPTGPKLALLRVLRSVGGPKALEAVRAATKDPAAEVKDTALRELCKWPTADALSDLGELARNSADPKVKILAVGGYLRLIRLQDAPADKKLATLKEAMPLAERKDEKRLVLAALGDIPTPDALALVTPYLGDPDLKEEASIAAVAIAEKIVQTHPAPVAEAMQKASTATSNTRLATRAKALLQQAQSKLPRK